MKPPGSVRVVSWNIRSCLEQGLEAVASVLGSLQADIVALQEVDRFTVRSGTSDQTAELARSCGFGHHRFFPATPWEGGGEYGIALISHHELLEPELVQLPIDGPEAHPSATEPRILASARLPGGLHVLNTHFGLTDSQRRRQAETVARHAAGAEPMILLGDFNATPDDPVLDPLRARFTDAAAVLDPARRITFPQPPPGLAIDHAFLSPAVTLLAVRVHSAAGFASDHYPLIVDLESPWRQNEQRSKERQSEP